MYYSKIASITPKSYSIQEVAKNGYRLLRMADPEKMPCTFDLPPDGSGDLFCYYTAILWRNQHVPAACQDKRRSLDCREMISSEKAAVSSKLGLISF